MTAESLFDHASAIERSAIRLMRLVGAKSPGLAIEMEFRILQRRLMRFPRDPVVQQAATDIENDEAAAGIAMRHPTTPTGPG